MFGLGTTELLIIAVIVLVIFGAKRLPDIGKGLGGAPREFRNIKKEVGSKPEVAQVSPQKSGAKVSGGEPQRLEGKAVDKMLEEVPGVKKVAEIKK